MVKASSVREKKGEYEEDEKNTPLVPLNQRSPNALQSLTVLCVGREMLLAGKPSHKEELRVWAASGDCNQSVAESKPVAPLEQSASAIFVFLISGF